MDGKFQPISWEQAYKEIAQKINLILLDNGPESIFWVNYPQPNQAYALRLMHSMGSPHYFTHGSTCYTARNAAWNFTVGKLPSNDLANSRFIMIVGRNPAGGIDLGQVKDIVKAKEKRRQGWSSLIRATAKPPSWLMNGFPSNREPIWLFCWQ